MVATKRQRQYEQSESVKNLISIVRIDASSNALAVDALGTSMFELADLVKQKLYGEIASGRILTG